MKKTILYLISCTIIFALFLVACQNNTNTEATSTDNEVVEAEEEIDEQFLYADGIYKSNCVSCHENSVAKFVDREWVNGNSWNEINRAIRYGHLFMDKADFAKAALPDSTYNKLTDYIMVKIEQQTIESFPDKPDSNMVFKSEAFDFKIEPVVTGMEIPWGIDFLPNGNILATDRNGKFYRKAAGSEKVEISGVPEVFYRNQGGLLDVKVHPDFANNQTIYLAYSEPNGKGEATTAVIKTKLINDALVDAEKIFLGTPYTKAPYHYGCRLEFDKDGYLYVTIGDRAARDVNPQDLSRYAGKIHRFNADGSIPEDNPFVGTEGAIPSIWSYGHRNPQGLVYDSETGIMWESEHAPRGGDEINIIEKGANYGWPVISYGINYNGTTFTNTTHKDGMKQPEFYYMPSTGTCGLTIVRGDKYSAWNGDLLAGSLRFGYISRLKMDGQKVVGEERLVESIGRLRDVKMGDDGYVYFTVENPGIVYRIVPVREDS